MERGKITKGTELWFGKHKGETVGDVMESDPGYLSWCVENIDWFEGRLKDGLLEEIEALS